MKTLGHLGMYRAKNVIKYFKHTIVMANIKDVINKAPIGTGPLFTDSQVEELLRAKITTSSKYTILLPKITKATSNKS